nr:hypothetical protein [Myxococcota bacterium]
QVLPARFVTVVGQPGIQDGRARFREIFCGLLEERDAQSGNGAKPALCEGFLNRLVDEPPPSERTRPWRRDASLRVIFVPGLFNECILEALPFDNAIEALVERGYEISTLVVSGRSSAEHNARAIAESLEKLRLARGQRLVLIGYSKGAVDSMEFLVSRPDLAGRVAALVSVAGAINGSPLAERFAGAYAELASDLRIDDCDPGDAGALEALKPSVRMGWLARHPLPARVRYFSLVTRTDAAGVSPGLSASYKLLADFDPLNDGQLLSFDQVIPGATLLGYADADHWRIVIAAESAPDYWRPLLAKDPFPQEVLLEAILVYVAESLQGANPAGAGGPTR